MVEPGISRAEHVVVAIIWVPLGCALNGLLFWGMRDVAFTPGLPGIVLNVFWLAIMVLLVRRARRDVDRSSIAER